jgi:hypothetical protein
MLREHIVGGDVARWELREFPSGELLRSFVWWYVKFSYTYILIEQSIVSQLGNTTTYE